MGSVLFVSQNRLGRCENLTAVWNAYRGEKDFALGNDAMRSAERDGYSVVVCDYLPKLIEGKSRVKSVNIGHGITGDKLYAADEKHKPWYDQAASDQIDYAISTSKAGVGIVANQFRIPRARVLPYGMPRTDSCFRDGFRYKSLGGRPVDRIYLYAPTYRNGDGRLPTIDWTLVDSLLEDGEVFVVKRHYFTKEPLMGERGHGWYRHVIEVSPDEPSEAYLRSCSVLLTDYSSIVFDAYLFGKPSVLAVDDKDVYLRKRGMYYDYPAFYSSRWISVEGNEERLVLALREAAATGMRAVERRCVATVAGACDGHSTERVCDLISRLAD